MKTKIEFKQKTVIEQLKELITTKVKDRVYIEQKNNKLTVVFDGVLTATQIQKIKDLLQNRFLITVEEIEDFPSKVK